MSLIKEEIKTEDELIDSSQDPELQGSCSQLNFEYVEVKEEADSLNWKDCQAGSREPTSEGAPEFAYDDKVSRKRNNLNDNAKSEVHQASIGKRPYDTSCSGKHSQKRTRKCRASSPYVALQRLEDYPTGSKDDDPTGRKDDDLGVSIEERLFEGDQGIEDEDYEIDQEMEEELSENTKKMEGWKNSMLPNHRHRSLTIDEPFAFILCPDVELSEDDLDAEIKDKFGDTILQLPTGRNEAQNKIQILVDSGLIEIEDRSSESLDNIEKNNEISVQNLKTISISSITLEEKIEIRDTGRPQPNLNIVQISKGKSREFKRTFNRDIYIKYEWICGCDYTNRLFCFPCLLFPRSSADPTWTVNGVADLSHLTQKAKKHVSSESHMSALLDMKLLGKQDIHRQHNSAYRRNIHMQNENVKKNRYVLSKIIECIRFCGAFELALRGHNEANDPLYPGILKGLINFSTELDLVLKEHFEKASVFKGTLKIIQNELLECMLQVCQDQIKKEISSAKFVSIIADETTDVSSIFQMAIVFRYVLPDGSPVERFWGFYNPVDHTAVGLSDCIKTILNQVVEDKEKLISQSYDGANVMSGRHAGVQNIIQKEYKYAFYVHCYAHQLNLILAQATSQNQEVRVFFANLSDITNFFSNSPQRVAILDKIVGKRVTRASNTRWNLKSRNVNCVFEYRESFIECMEEIVSTSKQVIAINQATALIRMLQDSTFVFWLTVFHRLLPHSDILYNQLQKTKTDPVEIHKAIKCFEASIQKERDNIGTVRQAVDSEESLTQMKRKRNDDPYISKEVAAKEACDTVITHVKERFSFTNHLNATILFLSENFQNYEQIFPTEYLDKTVDVYPFLEKDKLKTELEIIYKRLDFRNMSGAVNFLKFFIVNNLEDLFSETFVLLRIIITMPITSAEAERNFSTLKRIKTFLRSSMNQERLTALAMLSIEKELARNLPEFNELVINKFAAQKKRRMDFPLKYCN